MIEKLLLKKIIILGIKIRIGSILVVIFVLVVFFYLIFKFFEDCYRFIKRLLKK